VSLEAQRSGIGHFTRFFYDRFFYYGLFEKKEFPGNLRLTFFGFLLTVILVFVLSPNEKESEVAPPKKKAPPSASRSRIGNSKNIQQKYKMIPLV
jgi:hypothetical protein